MRKKEYLIECYDPESHLKLFAVMAYSVKDAFRQVRWFGYHPIRVDEIID